MPVSAISNPIKKPRKKDPNGNYVRILVLLMLKWATVRLPPIRPGGFGGNSRQDSVAGRIHVGNYSKGYLMFKWMARWWPLNMAVSAWWNHLRKKKHGTIPCVWMSSGSQLHDSKVQWHHCFFCNIFDLFFRWSSSWNPRICQLGVGMVVNTKTISLFESQVVDPWMTWGHHQYHQSPKAILAILRRPLGGVTWRLTGWIVGGC